MNATATKTTTLKTTVETLKAALAIAARIANGRNNIPVLNHALIAADGFLCATDLELYCRIPFYVSADHPKEGFLIPVRPILDAIKKLKTGNVQIDYSSTVGLESVRCHQSESGVLMADRCRWTAGDVYVKGYSGENCPACKGSGYVEETVKRTALTMEVGAIKYTFETLPAVDMPAMPAWVTESATTMPADSWRAMFSKVLPAVSKEESRYTLRGVSFEKTAPLAPGDLVRMIATDGHRLHLVERGSAPSGAEAVSQELIPSDLVKVLLATMPKGKHGHEYVSFGRMKKADAGAVIESVGFQLNDGLELICRAHAGQFPNWRAVVTVGRNVDVTLSTAAMLDAIKAIAPTADKASRTVTLSIARSTDDTLTLSTPSASVPVAGIVAHVVADDYKAGFNVDYLLSVFSQASEPHLVMSASDADSAHSFSCCATGNHTGSEQFIVMPMRIK